MSEKRRPPGPTWKSESERPWRDRLGELTRGTIPLIRSRFERYGDLYFIDRKGAGVFVLRHPDHIHEVLVDRVQDFAKQGRDLDFFLGSGLLTSNGDLWRRQRRLIQPAFRHQKLEAYARVMVDRTATMLERWKPGETKDVGREMMELTLSVVAKTLLDYDTTEDAGDVAKAMALLQDTTAAFDPFPEWLPTPLHGKRKKAVETIDRIIYPIIDAAEADPEADHLIGQLKHASDEEGRMSRKQLRDEIVTLFLAGHETTAQAMTFAFFSLCKNAHEEALLHEEVDRVLGGRPPAFEDVESLVYTQLCFKEALRLYPPLYILPRLAVRDTQIAGYDVDEGAELILWIYLCHRDPRWFPNPDAFVPGRFLPESNGVRHAHAYLPFGAGIRQCVGSHFGMIEGTLLLAAIAQRYRLTLASDQDVHLAPRVTLGPLRPILMRLEAR
jgi:cytochrome P450